MGAALTPEWCWGSLVVSWRMGAASASRGMGCIVYYGSASAWFVLPVMGVGFMGIVDILVIAGLGRIDGWGCLGDITGWVGACWMVCGLLYGVSGSGAWLVRPALRRHRLCGRLGRHRGHLGRRSAWGSCCRMVIVAWFDITHIF